MTRSTILLIATCTLSAMACGCGTIFMRPMKGARGMACYPATTYDASIIATGGGIYAYGDCDNGLGPVLGWAVVVPLHVADLPFSLTTDTLCLPFDLHRTKIRMEEASREFPLATSTTNAMAPELILTSKSRYSPAFFRCLPSGEETHAFPGDIIRPPGSTNAYRLVEMSDGVVILRREKAQSSKGADAASGWFLRHR